MVGVITWGNQHLTLEFAYSKQGAVHLCAAKRDGIDLHFKQNLPLVDILLSGRGHELSSKRLIQTHIGKALQYHSHVASEKDGLHLLDIHLVSDVDDLGVVVHYVMPNDVAMFRTYVTVENKSLQEKDVYLESVTSWSSDFGAFDHAEADYARWTLWQADSEWLGEGRWHAYRMKDMFPELRNDLIGHNTRSEHAVVSDSTWSTGKNMPLAFLQSDAGDGAWWCFQVEHNGAWRWEVGRDGQDGYMALSGPTAINHDWIKRLASGESFDTVAASVSFGSDLRELMGTLTAYRRAMRLPHADNKRPRILFNDYMNTINGDPTTDKLLPLIEAAALTGVEIFCIDCGWYDDGGDWWPSVGEWMPSKTRFPRGITEVTDAIKSKGMVPGIWLEPEVVGVKSPMVSKLPETAFMRRRGQLIEEQQRLFLDFRSADARAYMDSVVDRLIDEYGIGYFKFDYNVQPGSGPDYNAESSGDGLLEHNHAYSAWIEDILQRHPNVILENCSSGGMREDFAQLSRFQVQSTSDQQDFRLYPFIAATAPIMMLPEQAANWAYPQSTMDIEETAFNINTTLLGRFFLSGYLNRMDSEQLSIVSQGVTVYKNEVRPLIGKATPWLPLGFAKWNDPVVTLGLESEDCILLTVWSRGIETTHDVQIEMSQLSGYDIDVQTIYPIGDCFATWDVEWNRHSNSLILHVPAGRFISRTFKISKKGR